jgi:cell division protein FtsQ
VSAHRLPIDPRIEQRRIEVRRHETRHRLRLLSGALAVVGLVGAGYGATRSALLDVDRVRVTGIGSTSREAVLEASGLAPRPGRRPLMVDVRTEVVARRLEGLPWVERALVRRRWPATVEVSIAERTPVAVVPAATQGWALVDVDGRVLATMADPPGDLVPVRAAVAAGPPGTAVDVETHGGVEVAAALRPPLAGRVSEVVVHPGGGVELTLRPRTTVRLGRPEQVGEKLVALVTLVERVDLRGVLVVDVRVPTAPVLTRGAPGG